MRWLFAIVLLILVALAALVLMAASTGAPGRGPAPSGAYSGGGPGPAAWDGPAACFPKAMVESCTRLVHDSAKGRFGPAGPGEVEHLTREAARLSRKYNTPLSARQLLSMRDLEVVLAAQTGGARALRHGPAMLAASRGGEPVVAIAERFRVPPTAALRQILLELGHSAAEVRSLVANPAQLPAGLAREAGAIAEADLGSRLNSERTRVRSQAYEDALGAHLRERLGLRFRTEADLRLAPDPRGPHLTPDFLLCEPARINGRAVHWVDAKDYPMYGNRLVARGLTRQAAKYTAAFGPGAMVFSAGVMCGAQVGPAGAKNEPLILDGSHVGGARPGAPPSAAARSSAGTTGSDGSTLA